MRKPSNEVSISTEIVAVGIHENETEAPSNAIECASASFVKTCVLFSFRKSPIIANLVEVTA